MDPEAGGGGLAEDKDLDSAAPSIVQRLFRLIFGRISGVFGSLVPKQRAVGVENRFYYDQTEKVWKLRGGESAEERAEAEAIRFHTSRGFSGAVPGTTACDASRGAGMLPPPPPPPAGGPVTQSLAGGGPASHSGSACLTHPVYAPGGLDMITRPPQTFEPPPTAPKATHAPLTSPFGASAAASQPIGAAPIIMPSALQTSAVGSAPAAPLTSPFARAPLADPFQRSTAPADGEAGPVGAPFQGTAAVGP